MAHSPHSLPGTCEWCGTPQSVRKGRRFCSRECSGSAKTAATNRLGDPDDIREAPLCGCMTDLPIRHGLCNRHWQQWKAAHPDVLPLQATPIPGGRFVLAKTCDDCDRFLPGDAFRRNQLHCRECENRRGRERDHSKPRRPPMRRRLYVRRTLIAATCNKCGELKSGDEFPRRHGLTCAQCHEEYTRTLRADKQAEALERAVNYRKQWTGPELELLLRDDLTNQELALLLGRSHHTISLHKSKVRRDPKYRRLAGISDGDP